MSKVTSYILHYPNRSVDPRIIAADYQRSLRALQDAERAGPGHGPGGDQFIQQDGLDRLACIAQLVSARSSADWHDPSPPLQIGIMPSSEVVSLGRYQPDGEWLPVGSGYPADLYAKHLILRADLAADGRQ